MQDEEQQHPPLHPDIFVGTSEMAELMRRHPWADTPLGPPERWPQALKVALRILLTSRFEMWLGWGPDIHFFYNDAYRPTLGAKHPRSLGMPTRELWAEIWDDIRERIEAVLQRGDSLTVAQGLDVVALWNAAFIQSDDLSEAVTAFFEKRPPEFKGQ